MQLVFGAVKLMWAGLMVVGKFCAWIITPLVRVALQSLSERVQRRRVRREAAVATVRVAVPELPEVLVQSEAPETIIRADTWEIADRIASIGLDPPVGSIHLRVYVAARVVKRDLIISEPCLKALMKGRRHTLPDAPYDPVAGLDGVKDETIELAERLINELGNRAVKARKPPKDEATRARLPGPAPTVQQNQKAPEPLAPALPPIQAPQQAPQAPTAQRVVAPRVTTGFTYVGKLVRASPQKVEPKGKAPYEIFEARLQLDNGAELALRGAELERELLSNGCQVGDKVAITPMGKVPVSLANGGEGEKNLYRVKAMGR
ncbi:hypothetical protein FN976_11240 [Caenimonas sedimenti]|uniref:Uncharacterized protein n=1 Tax=Caenimonas sedimenti TaxID=2596921 RepID=A0A562ZSY2_9BURK|nr:hypothetical protein [Caenimonas sedimenti]TWO71481.1 hypothetical protein FN976_11240 [Caenimonas sedimenti]